MKRTFIIIPIIFCVLSLSAQNYSRVQLDLREHNIHELAELGVEVEHGHFKKHKFYINDYSDVEIAKFVEAGIPFKILIDDVVSYYANQEAAHLMEKVRSDCDQGGELNVVDKYTTPENYQYGSMGGYLTFDQLKVELDKMSEAYPNLISPRIEIGQSHEGRSIFYLRISNNPMMDEDKPEILYTSIHHAREPNSLSQLVFYMWYVLENYESDDQIKFLIDNTELYFIPMINPDGYVYNEINNGNGGGLWRKNRRDNGDGSFGVDLNRNYSFEWGFNDSGSSPFTFDDTYRGPGPNSEPEIQAVVGFVQQHEFQICLNYHSFSNVLIHPWGYENEITEDDAIFKGMAHSITQENAYPYGTAFETIGYNANGNSDDWFYADESKPKIFAMTPEVGPGLFGFWPPEVAIDELNKFCVLQNITAANLLHNYIDAIPKGGKIIPALGSFEIEVKQYGLAEGMANVKIVSLTEGLAVDENAEDLELEILESKTISVDYSFDLDPQVPKSDVVFEIQIDYGTHIVRNQVNRIIQDGEMVPIYELDDANLDLWVSEKWNQTDVDFYSEPFSIADSPFGRYANNEYNEIELKESIQLDNIFDANLTFFAKWEIEDDYDYAQVLISADGAEYEPVCGSYTNDGSEFQDLGQPLYDGFQEEWVQESIDLNDYLGQEIKIKFRLVSDNFLREDGFYFDDLQINTLVNTGASQDIIQKDLEIYPNPASDKFIVSYKGEQYLQSVNVFDVSGKKIYKDNLRNKVAKIDCQHWAPGSYIIKIILSDGQEVSRLCLKD